MRILHVIHSLNIGGAEKLLVDMLPVMKNKGHQVAVYLLQDCDSPFKRSLEKNGIAVITAPFKAGRYSLRQASFLKELMQNYDVVHAHCMPATIAVALGSNGLKSLPQMVLTLHSTTIAVRDRAILRPLAKYVFSKYDRIIGCSQMATDAMLAVLPKFEVTTINNGINLSLFSNAEPADRRQMVPDYRNDDVIVSMVAGFREAKDQDCLIRSLTHLPDNFKLCFVGDGVRRPILEEMIKDLRLTNRVRLLGLRQDIPSLLRASDFVVLSSHYEGLSLASIEGMASGHPFIASRVVGLKELVEGVGLLFPESDEKALAALLLDTNNDKKKYEKVVKRCLHKAKEFDIETTVDRYLSAYK